MFVILPNAGLDRSPTGSANRGVFSALMDSAWNERPRSWGRTNRRSTLAFRFRYTQPGKTRSNPGCPFGASGTKRQTPTAAVVPPRRPGGQSSGPESTGPTGSDGRRSPHRRFQIRGHPSRSRAGTESPISLQIWGKPAIAETTNGETAPRRLTASTAHAIGVNCPRRAGPPSRWSLFARDPGWSRLRPRYSQTSPLYQSPSKASRKTRN